MAAEYFWVPTTIDERGDGLVLDYALEEHASLPFAVAQPRLNKQLAVHLPEIVGMAIYLGSCAKVLDQTELPAVIAPAYLRYMPATGGAFGAWRLMVVPHVDVALADWANSSPDAWRWVSAQTLLGKPAHPGYAVGAALYAAIAGDLFPDDLSTSEQFRRLLRGQVGARDVLEHAITNALPPSFSDEGAALATLIRGLLSPAPPAMWSAQLDELGGALDPYRTAVRWEYEGRVDTARGILERFAATAPKANVPWDVLSRLRGLDHDRAGALDAAISALGGGDGHAIRDLAAQVRKLAHEETTDQGEVATRRDMIVRAVAAADKLGAQLGDTGRLHFAHIEARYLQRWDEARARLAIVAKDPWDNILRQAILARVHAASSEWAHVAKLCKEARLATKAMEHGGGQLGGYVVAYLDHLDGIAHFGAVGVYADPLYLADAFQRFVSSLDAARTICAPDDPLIDANILWLSWIGAMAHQMKVPDANTIRTGVEAYLGAHGLASRISEKQRREVPPLVWYDASRLLALSGAP